MKKMRTEELDRTQYLSEISLRYRDNLLWPKARKHASLNCPHCILNDTVTTFKDKAAFWTHINTAHRAPSVSCLNEHRIEVLKGTAS